MNISLKNFVFDILQYIIGISRGAKIKSMKGANKTYPNNLNRAVIASKF